MHATGYDLERFRTEPDFLSGVVRFDLPRLGDVRGLDAVHLQCHIGTDTLSLARAGATVTAGESFGEVESTKSVSDVYSPVSGEVVEVNAILENEPETINSSPFEDGWLFRARISEEPSDLLSAEEYTKLT